MSQFYFLFNLSRLVPNSLSMFMVLVTTASWFSRRNMTFIALATITVVGFHSVTILLFIPMVFYSLVIRKTMPLGRSIIMCASVSYLTFITTSLLDSYMWGEYVWSQSKLFKDLLNRSTIDLGFSTLTWYTLIALPRYLLFSIIFVPFASRRCIKSAFMVSYSYLVLCSLCNYKDFDLVIYCYPLLNTCAANAIAISFYRFFTLQPHTESWLLYLIRRKLGYQVTSLEEFEAEEKKMDDQEKLEKNRDSFWDNITIDRSRNDSVNLYEPLAPAEWLALGPPPYTSTASSSPLESPEETPLTSDVHLQLNQSPRVRKPIQSSPTNFLRRRGGLRKALTGHKSVTTCNTHRDDQTSDDQSTSIRPKRIPIETDSIIHSEASHFGSVLAALVTFQFLANAIAVFYYASTTCHCYPGGEAVAWLNEHIKQTELPLIEPQEIGVYLGKRTVETGYTRFLQINGITYDTSSDIYTLAIKDQRLQKYHNKFDSNERNKNKRTKNDGQNFDFKVIYFILDRVDGSFFNLNCRSHPSGQSNGETIIQPLNTIISTDQDSKFCKLSHELVNCPIIKIIDSYGGLELSRLHISIGIIREPTLWIIKCLIPN
ncbi:uncharacterized protein LOC128389015 [Panonychus citri]|uniref:uncharacterized protein LOC128389015 n=1 Tax=Panonychus citri TaxID=50023 RepID=UPI002307E64F|nr:uncharacterized protein LOC128389015 [Panonychus citri]